MSITAFPVLVRILKDRKLFGSSLGQSATLCAAGDVTAWCILAFVVAIAGAAKIRAASFNLGLVGFYVVVMIAVIRPLLSRLLGGSLYDEFEPGKGVLALSSASSSPRP